MDFNLKIDATELERVFTKLDNIVNKSVNISKNFKKASDSAKEMGRETGKINTNLKNAAKATDMVSKNTKKAKKSTDILGKLWKQITKTADRMAFVITATFSYNTYTGALNAISDAYKGVLDLEDKFVEIKSLLTSLGDEADNLARTLINIAPSLSVEFGEDIQEVTEGLYQTVSAGRVGEDAIQAFEASAKLAKVTNADLAVTIKLVNRALNSFGKDGTEAMEVAEQLFKIIQKGQVRMSELEKPLGKLLGTAGALGLQFPKVASDFATIVRQLPSREAATSLVNAFVRISKEGKYMDTLRLEGLTGFVKILKSLPPERVYSLIPSVRGAKGAQAILNDLNTALEQQSYFIGEAEALQKSYAEKIGTTSEQIKGLTQETKANYRIVINESKSLGLELKIVLNDISKAILGWTRSMKTFKKWILKPIEWLEVLDERIDKFYEKLGLRQRKYEKTSIMGDFFEKFSDEGAKSFTTVGEYADEYAKRIIYLANINTEAAKAQSGYYSTALDVLGKNVDKTGKLTISIASLKKEIESAGGAFIDFSIVEGKKLEPVTKELFAELYKQLQNASNKFSLTETLFKAGKASSESLKEVREIGQSLSEELYNSIQKSGIAGDIKNEWLEIFAGFDTVFRESTKIDKTKEIKEIDILTQKYKTLIAQKKLGINVDESLARAEDDVTSELLTLALATKKGSKEWETYYKWVDKTSKKVEEIGKGGGWKSSLDSFLSTWSGAISSAMSSLSNFIGSTFDMINGKIDRQLENAISTLDKQKTAEENYANSSALTESQRQQALSNISEKYAEKQAEIEKKANEDRAKQEKKQAKFNAVMNLAEGSMSLWSNIKTWNLPVILGLQAALAAVFAKQMNVINKTKFAKGGVLQGASHSNGGIDLGNGQEAEGGEPILTKGVSRNPILLKMASLVNQLGGGINFSGSSINTPKMAQGGMVGNLNLGSSSLDRILSSLSKLQVVNLQGASDVDLYRATEVGRYRTEGF